MGSGALETAVSASMFNRRENGVMLCPVISIGWYPILSWSNYDYSVATGEDVHITTS